MNCLIYDIEIVKAIPPRGDEPRIDGIEYCAGWHDHANMGVSVIGAFDYVDQRYRVFCRDNFEQFQELVDQREWIVGFNSIAFDNEVVKHEGLSVPVERSYDLLVELWRAAGLGPKFNPKSHGGFGLDAVSAANFGTRKSGNGALAPIDWQFGRIGNVVDYCLNDVLLTKNLLDRVQQGSAVVVPRQNNTELLLQLRRVGE